MSTPAFFVQNNYVERLTAPVAIHARSHGIALEDRSSHKDFDPDRCGIDWSRYDPVLPYGSVQFVRQLKASSLARYILHDEERFATSAWAAEFGSEALNGGGRIVSAGEVAAMLDEGPCHLRPDMVDKAFVGGVFDRKQWEDARAERNLTDDLACWASPLQNIDKEWRCWVIGGRVVEISKYREAGRMALGRETSREVWATAQRFADRYLPAPCVVLDVAAVGDTYKLIEFNPIHCAGWYMAQVDIVLEAWLRWAITHSSAVPGIFQGA